MARVKIVLSYDGSAFRGFQSQKTHTNTVMTTIIKALKSVGIFATPIGSGRTDKGVHASNQVLHLDIPEYWQDLHRLKTNLNNKLKKIYIKSIINVSSDFHSRFDAIKRTYRYIISTKNSVFQSDYVTYYPSIDMQKIEKSIKYFVGTHDFEYFRKTGSDENNTIRTIYDIKFYQYKHYYIFNITANSFLRSQIRIIIGLLISPHEIKDITNKLNKISNPQFKIAPGNGLYLQRIYY